MNNFFKKLEILVSSINSAIWGPTTIIFILLIGVLFSIRLKFFQIIKFKFWFEKTFGTLFNKRTQKAQNKNITPFQAMTTALAGAIGTGNIVGVATAITLGGPGAIFWMWVAALFGMIIIFSENILGVIYRVKGKSGEWIGGPMYYMKNGLKSKTMPYIFSIACILATFGIGNMTQSNSISGSLQDTFGIKTSFSGMILSLLSGIIIFGGIKRIANVTEKVVPFMALFYIIGGIIILLVNIKNVPSSIFKIFSEAFNFGSFASGTSGFVVSNAIKYGISRGIFTNEAGLGSSPIIHACADTDEPIIQGMWGIFQVFIDTFVVCSITALCILSTGVVHSGKEGVALSTAAFESVFGSFGNVFICISTVLFAFATIISWSYYGERSLEFMSGSNWVILYRSLYVVLIMFGSSLNLSLVWSLSDIFNVFMCIPNLMAILLLSNKVVDYVKKYNENMTCKPIKLYNVLYKRMI